jgi:phosphomannomutase
VRSADGWWLIRASNTEAALVARAEARSATGLEQLIDEIHKTLKVAGLDWQRP